MNAREKRALQKAKRELTPIYHDLCEVANEVCWDRVPTAPNCARLVRKNTTEAKRVRAACDRVDQALIFINRLLELPDAD